MRALLPSTLVLLLVCAHTILGGGVARAASPAVDASSVQRGVAAYEALEYDRAVVTLEAALKESLTRDERLVALQTLAFAQFALGREAETRAALDRLLRIDPSHQLDRRFAPRLRSLLEEARARLATQPASNAVAAAALPRITLRVEPTTPREGQPLTLRLDDRRDAPALAVYHRSGSRRGEAPAFSRVEAPRAVDGSYRIVLPGAVVHAPQLDYYAVLLDGAGTPLAAAGALGAPLQIAITATPRPLYKKAWFWGTLGGIAAAGALAAVLAVTLTPQPPASVTIQPH